MAMNKIMCLYWIILYFICSSFKQNKYMNFNLRCINILFKFSTKFYSKIIMFVVYSGGITIYTTNILHIYYIYTTYILHIYYIYTTYILHIYYIYTTYILHIYYIYTTYILHIYYIYTTYILHIYYIYI